jgi:membrane protease YdiL (CAAX protease family)
MREYTKYLMWTYITAILVAEWLLTYVNVLYGLLVHSVVFIATILVYWKNWSRFTIQGSLVLLAFSYISLSRLVGVSIINEVDEMILILVFVNAPLLVCLMECLRGIEISITEFISPARRHVVREVLISLTGIIFGLTEIRLIEVRMIPWFNLWSFMLYATTIVILTGFYEELLFRGIILKYLADVGSKWFALAYTSILFAVMHVSWMSFADMVFVFLVGFFYGVVFLRTKSLVGISISHGLTNLFLFLP